MNKYNINHGEADHMNTQYYLADEVDAELERYETARQKDAGRLVQVKGERDALLKSDAENVDEFNAGFDAYNSGMDLDNAEEFYRACKREEGVPSYDSFSTGYAWAKFVTERAAALKDAK